MRFHNILPLFLSTLAIAAPAGRDVGSVADINDPLPPNEDPNYCKDHCDCTGLTGEAFFQCVTNPNCEALCWGLRPDIKPGKYKQGKKRPPKKRPGKNKQGKKRPPKQQPGKKSPSTNGSAESSEADAA